MQNTYSSFSVCPMCNNRYIKSSGWIYKRRIQTGKSKGDGEIVAYCSYRCMRQAERAEENLDKIDVKAIKRDYCERGMYVETIACKHKLRIDTVENIIKSF